jgi:hypothetical protein
MQASWRNMVTLFCAFGLAPVASQASEKIEASKCLHTNVQVSQEIGNTFSRTIAFHITGFDDFVRRVSGTGAYKVLTVSPEEIVSDSSFLYDGAPVSKGETAIKDDGRTICWKGKCSPATDASGVSMNPLLWGAPSGTLHLGQRWEVSIPIPWELGPAGKQLVKILSIDPKNDSITLERTGAGDGDTANEIKKLPLVKDKNTYTVDVSMGAAKWRGRTTFRNGIIVSDVLLVERAVTVNSKEFGQSTGTERQYILLNESPLGSPVGG